jgi:hypothetical protein
LFGLGFDTASEVALLAISGLGYLLVVLFLLSWGISFLIWKVLKIEERRKQSVRLCLFSTKKQSSDQNKEDTSAVEISSLFLWIFSFSALSLQG